MTSANVTNIAALAMMASPTVDKTKSMDADFSNVMMQTSNNRQELTKDVKSSNVSTVKQDDTSLNDSYEANKSDLKASNISSSTDNQELDSEVVEEIVDEFNEFIQKTFAELKEAFDVSDEDIENALILLNLNQCDLLNPSNVSLLVGEITQVEDSIALILDANVSDTLSHITDAANFMLEKVGLELTDVQNVIETSGGINISDMELVQGNETFDDLGLDLHTDKLLANNQVEAADTTQVIADNPSIESFVKEAIVEDDKLLVSDEVDNNNDSFAQKQSQVEVEVTNQVNDEADEDSQKKDSFSNNESSRDSLFTKENVGVSFQQTADSISSDYVDATKSVSNQTPVDTQEVIDQIVEHARTTITKESSSMEMILNPEHLGKVFLQVTEKAGVVKAQIQIQNQELKEALTNQMSIIRDNLEKVGVKVEAIEVSVSAHEFEKNLEENLHNQENQAQDYEEHASNMRRHRNINMNDIDDISDDITEEEALIAQIMKDEGNTLNYMA